MTPCERVWAPIGLAGVDVGLDKATDDVQVPPEKDSGGRPPLLMFHRAVDLLPGAIIRQELLSRIRQMHSAGLGLCI